MACGLFCSCITSTSDSAQKHRHTRPLNRGIRYEPATTASHRGQPSQPAYMARPGVKDHVTARRHEHRDSALHPATLTGTHPAHKTSVPLLLTKVSSEPHNSHRSGEPAAWHPGHNVSATPWPDDSGSQQTGRQRIRSGTSPGRVH